MIDSLISKENLDMLDKHADTLDRVGELMGKAERIINSPVISKLTDIVMQQTSVKNVVDPWDQTIGDISSAPVAVAAPLTSTAPQPQIQQPKSQLHQNFHDSIDSMSEEELEKFISGEQQKIDETESQSTGNTDPEPDATNN